jgi:hypothetical protein
VVVRTLAVYHTEEFPWKLGVIQRDDIAKGYEPIVGRELVS